MKTAEEIFNEGLREELEKAFNAGMEFSDDWGFEYEGEPTHERKPNFDRWYDKYLKQKGVTK